MIADLKTILLRDLDRLKAELDAFETEESLWQERAGISNTAGNLILHICGNLRHFIGSVIGDSGYIRQREDEFNLRGRSKTELAVEIERTRLEVQQALDAMPHDLLDKPYPIEVFGKPMSHGHFLIHLSGHLNYHLGQVNYYRRIQRD